MPLQHAINFLTDAAKDQELRSSLYTVRANEVFPTLESQGYKFTYGEFEESINMLHVKCQTEEQASLLFEVVNWFKMILGVRS